MKRLLFLVGLLVAVQATVAAVVKTVASRRHSYGDEESDTFDLVVSYGEEKLESRARSFAGGSVLVMFGAAEVDLRTAQLDPMGAYLEVDCWLGGVEIYVPDNWRVLLNSRTYLGGADNEASDLLAALPDDAPTIEIDARIVLGGLDIRPVGHRDVARAGAGAVSPA